MAPHNEIQFAIDICNHLCANGWLYGPQGSNGNSRALISAAVTGQIDVRGAVAEPADTQDLINV